MPDVQLVRCANEDPGNGITSGVRPDDRRNTSGFSVNGQDDTLNNWIIDGMDDNERVIGTIGVKPNVDLRAGFTRINNLSLPLNYGKNPDTALGFGTNMNFNALSSFLTPVGIGPFSDLGDGAYVPLQDIDNTYLYAATISYTRGNHSMKASAPFIRCQARNVQSAFAAGQYSFGLASDQATTQHATLLNNGGNDRPNLVGNPNLAHKTLTEFFNTAQFAPQPVGTSGNVQRNSLFGPHFDVSLVKDFPIAGSVNLQFRAEAFDITNTPN
jgi:hypothetical protein